MARLRALVVGRYHLPPSLAPSMLCPPTPLLRYRTIIFLPTKLQIIRIYPLLLKPFIRMLLLSLIFKLLYLLHLNCTFLLLDTPLPFTLMIIYILKIPYHLLFLIIKMTTFLILLNAYNHSHPLLLLSHMAYILLNLTMHLLLQLPSQYLYHLILFLLDMHLFNNPNFLLQFHRIRIHQFCT